MAEGEPWSGTRYEYVKKHLGAVGALSKQYWRYLTCKVWQEGCEEEEEASSPSPGKHLPPFSPSSIPQKNKVHHLASPSSCGRCLSQGSLTTLSPPSARPRLPQTRPAFPCCVSLCPPEPAAARLFPSAQLGCWWAVS